jgi:undecaprenyl-phosphate galactose phosphotransferase/putative colanic acid biosynthesis UDP-glucose lipid carrier transferase
VTNLYSDIGSAETGANVRYFRHRIDAAELALAHPDIGPLPPDTVLSPVISNEQASSKLSLFVTSLVIVVTSLASGNLFVALSGQTFFGIGDFLTIGIWLAVIFCGILRLSGGREPMKPSSIHDRAHRAFVAWAISFALLLAVAFALKTGADLSRGAIISNFLLGLVIVPASHMNVPILLARFQKSSLFKSREVILIGPRRDPALANIVMEFRQSGCPMPHLVEFNAQCGDLQWPEERKAILNRVTALAHRLGPGEIYVAGSQISHTRIQGILRALTLIPRAVFVVPDSFTGRLLRHRASEIGKEIAVAIQQEPMNRLGRAFKRMVDILFSAAGIAFLAPLLVTIVIAIKCDSPGPVLFRQTRNGHRGRPFRILKFRTMSVMEDGDIIIQARKDDSRVTGLGKFLRKTSLDELPQLFNVLFGEMSLIGPRPHAKAHDTLYAKLIENYEIRQHVKPGITGWAQVNGLRGETQTLDLMRQRIEFDLWYAKNCSIFLDMRILARTVLEVLRPSNAY